MPRWLLVAASVLATLPIWIPPFPAMADLPQHAAQIALLRGLQDPAFPHRDLFEINWFTPYLADLLVYPLVPLIGMVSAIKLITALALAAVPLTSALVMREAGTDERWGLLTIPGMYGVSYQWGFLNFLIAAPLGLVLVTLAFRQARSPRLPRDLGIAAIMVILFFSHVLACAFFGAISALLLGLQAPSPARAARRLLPFLVGLPLVATWLPGFRSHPLGAEPVFWDLGFNRLASAFTWIFGFPHAISLVCGLVIAALPLAAGATFRSGPVWAPLLVCLLTVLFVPAEFMAGTGLFQRFTWFLFPFYSLVFDRPSRRPWPGWVWGCCLVIVSVSVAVASVQALLYRRESAPFVRLLATMTPGARAVWLPISPASVFELAPPYLHFGAWYSATTQGVVDASMAAAHTPLVRYRSEHRPAIRNFEFERNPRIFDWSRMNGSTYRYYMAISTDDPGPIIQRGATCAIHRTFHEGRWWLYELEPGCR